DGRLDLLVTARAAGEVIWYENTADASGSSAIHWNKHVIDAGTRGPVHGEPVDMDGDGDMDVVMASGGMAEGGGAQIAWYENNGSPGDKPWRKHTIREAFADAFEAVAADLDGDGRMEVLATSHRMPGRLVWFKDNG